MMTIENISCNIDMGQRQFIIELFDKDANIVSLSNYQQENGIDL